MLTRLIIRLRVPTAVLAVLLSIVMIASFWIDAGGSVHVAPLRTSIGVEVVVDGIAIAWGKLDWVLPSGFSIHAAASWRRWSLWPRLDRFGGYSSVINFMALPHWAIVAPLAALALAGSRARRKQLALGLCPCCNYPLKGASLCPECGRSAPSN